MLVPLRIPANQEIFSILAFEESDLIIGIPPATEASKPMNKLFFSANLNSSSPCKDIIALLAVMKSFLDSRACFATLYASSIPPITSMTTSMESFLLIDSKSV